MDFLTLIAGGLLSSTTVLAAGVYFFQTSFTRLLDKRMEVFKQQLQIGTTLHELTLKSQIEFRERQLGEFYGPICAILKRGQLLYKVFEDGKLTGIETAINDVLVEGNNTIVSILLQKSHLIADDKIPDSHIHFLTHVAVWHALQRSKPRIPPPSKATFPEAHYPEQFEADILRTTEQLKRQLFDLHKQFGILAKPEA